MQFRHSDFIKVISLSASLLLAACGGGSDSNAPGPGADANTSGPVTPNSVTGVFVDDPVAGLRYQCSSGASGITNTAGEFTCMSGDTVTFFLGNLELGSVQAEQTITPYSLFPDDPDAAINLARLLQSVDSDGDSSNGVIELNSTLVALIPPATDFADSDFTRSLEDALAIRLVSAIQAESQLNSTIASVGAQVPGRSLTHNGLLYRTVASPYTGRIWLDRNLGASTPCNSANDSNCFGDYYQWGRETDGHEKSSSGTTSVIAAATLSVGDQFITGSADWSGVDSDGSSRSAFWTGDAGICPAGFRVPSKAEWAAEIIANGVNGSDAVRQSFLQLPAAGVRSNSSGNIGSSGSLGALWASTHTANTADSLVFDRSGSYVNDPLKNIGTVALGYNVRCIQNLPPVAIAGADQTVPPQSGISLDGSSSYDPDGAIVAYAWFVDGEFHSDSSNLDLDSLSYGFHLIQLQVTDNSGSRHIDQATVQVTAETTLQFQGKTYNTIQSPYTGRIWLDRNLGAFAVCGETVTPSDCYGDYYQFGRSADGHEKIFNSNVDRQAVGYLNSEGSNNLVIPEDLLNGGYSDDWAKDDYTGDNRSKRWATPGGICPRGFRVPSLGELVREYDRGQSNFETDAFLKLPLAGYRNETDGSRSHPDRIGFYWTHEEVQNFSGESIGVSLKFDTNTRIGDANDLYPFRIAMPIRCIRANIPPVAEAGTSVTIAPASDVTLDGSGSSDDEGIASYQWRKDGVEIANTVSTVVTGLALGKHVFELIVTDVQGDSDSDKVVVRVSDRSTTSVEFQGQSYAEVISPFTQRIWLDRNLGASAVCSSPDDENCFGGLYQWGRRSLGHQQRDSAGINLTSSSDEAFSNTQFILADGNSANFDWSRTDLNGINRLQRWLGNDQNNICPSAYRPPSVSELAAETSDNIESLRNSADAYRSFLHLPAAGARSFGSGSILSAGTIGNYWTLNLGSENGLSESLTFNYDRLSFGPSTRGIGQSLRCIKDEFAPVADIQGVTRLLPGSTLFLDASGSSDPDGSISSYAWWSGDTLVSSSPLLELSELAEGQHQITLVLIDNSGLETVQTTQVLIDPQILLSHDGVLYETVQSPTTGAIWLDRNLGASRACESIDDELCLGGYFQWGRNKDGHELLDSQRTTILQSDVINTDDQVSFNESFDDWSASDHDLSIRLTQWGAIDGRSVCPAGFNVPTEAQFDLERDNGLVNETVVSNSFLKLPINAAGVYVWTSTPRSAGSSAFYAFSNNDFTRGETQVVKYSYPVRCIREEAGYRYPLAIAGQNQTVIDGDAVYLSGSLSQPGEAPIDTYAWYLDDTLIAAKASLEATDIGSLIIGKHRFKLVVTDTNGQQGFDTVTVTVKSRFDEIDEFPMISYQGYEYGVIKSPVTGRYWLDRNLRAERACLSVYDLFCFGGYYQYGRKADGHELFASPTTTERLSSWAFSNGGQLIIDDRPGDLFYNPFTEDPADFEFDWADNDPDGSSRSAFWHSTIGICPAGFRVPTIEEAQAEDWSGALREGHYLKFPLAGERNYRSDFLSNRGNRVVYEGIDERGYFWVTPKSYFSLDGNVVENLNEAISGRQVRCILDTNNPPPSAELLLPNYQPGDTLQVLASNPQLYTGSGTANAIRASIIRYQWRNADGEILSVDPQLDTSLLPTGLQSVFFKVVDSNLLSSGELELSLNIIADSGSTAIVHQGVSYLPVTSPNTGRVWLDRNLGAAQPCISINDTSCYGWYFQWGRDKDGHEDPASATTSTLVRFLDSTTNEFVLSSATYRFDWAFVADGSGNLRHANWNLSDASSICPLGYRVPSSAEIIAETSSQGLNNRTAVFNSFLKLPSAGSRLYTNGDLTQDGLRVTLWSADIDSDFASAFFAFDASSNVQSTGRALGNPVRCIEELP